MTEGKQGLPEVRLDRDDLASSILDGEPGEGSVPGADVQNPRPGGERPEGSQERTGQEADEDVGPGARRIVRKLPVEEPEGGNRADGHAGRL